MNKEDEEVLVLKTDDLFPSGVWEGFKKYSEEKIIKLINSKGLFLKRGIVENDSSYQQIIPQIILKVGNKIFIHKTPKSGNESRLHDMWPIFLGGHVNNFDGDIHEAIEREFEEEIDYKGKILKREFWGLVKLNQGDVNKVHTGLIYVFEGDSEEFLATEDKGLIEGKFEEIAKISEYLDKMTHWSKLVAPFVLEKYLI